MKIWRNIGTINRPVNVALAPKFQRWRSKA